MSQVIDPNQIFTIGPIVFSILLVGDHTYGQLDELALVNRAFYYEVEKVIYIRYRLSGLHPHFSPVLPRFCRFRCPCPPFAPVYRRFIQGLESSVYILILC